MDRVIAAFFSTACTVNLSPEPALPGGARAAGWIGAVHFAVAPGEPISAGHGLTLQPMTALDEWQRRAVTVAAHEATRAAQARIATAGGGNCAPPLPVSLYVTPELTVPPLPFDSAGDRTASFYHFNGEGTGRDVIAVGAPAAPLLYDRMLQEVATLWYHRGCGSRARTESADEFIAGVTAATDDARATRAELAEISPWPTSGKAKPTGEAKALSIGFTTGDDEAATKPTRRARRRERRRQTTCTTTVCGQ